MEGRLGRSLPAGALAANVLGCLFAGATEPRGVAGFGARSRIRATKIRRLPEDLPIVVEIVDRPDLDGMVREGLATLGKAGIIEYRHDA